MTWFVSAVLIAIVTFTITNIDDVLVLAIFFAQSKSNPALKKRHVIMGQYLGFSVLVLASLLVFLMSLVIPLAWVGLLGLIPLGQGIFRLIKLVRKQPQEEQHQQVEEASPDQASATPRFLRSVLTPRIYSIATITISNGSDNISIYPLSLHMEGLGNSLLCSSSFS